MNTKKIYMLVVVIFAIALVVTTTLLVTNSIHNSNAGNQNNVSSNNRNSTGEIINSNTFPSTVGEILTMKVGYNNNYIVRGRENDVHVALDFKAVEHKFEKDIPLNLSLVLDKSGSMVGDKIDHAKASIIGLVESLSEKDYISIITYDDGVNLLVDSGTIKDIESIKEAVKSISANGGTCIECGLREGINQVSKIKQADYVNRVILFSDGIATTGMIDAEGLGKIASGGREQGVTISTMGFGMDYDEKLMTHLAVSGSGNYEYIRYAEDIRASLNKELSMMKSTIASEVKLNVVQDPNIGFVKTFGYEYISNNGFVEIPIRNFFSGDEGKVFLHFATAAGEVSDPNIRISLSYLNLIDGKRKEDYETGVALNITSDIKVYNENINKNVMSAVLGIKSTLAMEDANMAFESGEKDKALGILSEFIYENKDLADEQTMNNLSQSLDTIKDSDYGSIESKHYLKENRKLNFSIQRGKSGN